MFVSNSESDFPVVLIGGESKMIVKINYINVE